MTFIRSRVAFALIGLLIVGGISAAIAMMTTSQPLHAAVVGAGQANASNTGSGAAAATTTPAAGGATTETTSTNTAPTTPPSAPATNPPSASGQVIGVSGPIVSVNTSAGTFIMTVNGSSLTVVVTGSTNFSGDAKSLSQLQLGKPAEVHGIKQANGSLLATEVNADVGAGAGG